MPTRQGSCNRCGQCCGAEYPGDLAYSADHPWAGAFYDQNSGSSLTGWAFVDLIGEWPHGALLGVQADQNGLVVIPPDPPYGETRIAGKGKPRKFYWVWVPGKGPVKDTSPGHDGSQHNNECPFLMGQEGETVRECGLVGTDQDHAFRLVCEASPPVQAEAQTVAEFLAACPRCSYSWV